MSDQERKPTDPPTKVTEHGAHRVFKVDTGALRQQAREDNLNPEETEELIRRVKDQSQRQS